LSTSTGALGEVFWDTNPAYAAQRDLALFQGYADPQLPLVDLGCGNGTQTRSLADHFVKVSGTEISPAAVEIARTKHAATNISYRVLAVLSPLLPKPSTKKSATGMCICGRCCINYRHRSRDGDTEYRAAAGDKRNPLLLSNCRQPLSPSLLS
jgi:SAM-dependent methyltransferase